MRFSALVTSGVASMAAQMLVEGTTTRSSLQIAAELAGLGVNLNGGADLDVIRVSMSALKDKLDPALAIYSDVVLHPSFPQSDLDRVKNIQLANVQREKVQPFTMGLRVLPILLYGTNHAYGQPLTGSGSEASVTAMTRADLVSFHRTWFKPNHATIVAVGDTAWPTSRRSWSARSRSGSQVTSRPRRSPTSRASPDAMCSCSIALAQISRTCWPVN